MVDVVSQFFFPLPGTPLSLLPATTNDAVPGLRGVFLTRTLIGRRDEPSGANLGQYLDAQDALPALCACRYVAETGFRTRLPSTGVRQPVAPRTVRLRDVGDAVEEPLRSLGAAAASKPSSSGSSEESSSWLAPMC